MDETIQDPGTTDTDTDQTVDAPQEEAQPAPASSYFDASTGQTVADNYLKV